MPTAVTHTRDNRKRRRASIHVSLERRGYACTRTSASTDAGASPMPSGNKTLAQREACILVHAFCTLCEKTRRRIKNRFLQASRHNFPDDPANVHETAANTCP